MAKPTIRTSTTTIQNELPHDHERIHTEVRMNETPSLIESAILTAPPEIASKWERQTFVRVQSVLGFEFDADAERERAVVTIRPLDLVAVSADEATQFVAVGSLPQ